MTVNLKTFPKSYYSNVGRRKINSLQFTGNVVDNSWSGQVGLVLDGKKVC
jgi:hypothetical protein